MIILPTSLDIFDIRQHYIRILIYALVTLLLRSTKIAESLQVYKKHMTHNPQVSFDGG